VIFGVGERRGIDLRNDPEHNRIRVEARAAILKEFKEK